MRAVFAPIALFTFCISCGPEVLTPVAARECIGASYLIASPNQEVLVEADIIENARRYYVNEYGVAVTDAGLLVWVDTAEDETRWEGQSVAARQHRRAREAGLQRYAIVWLDTQDELGRHGRRDVSVDQCGNPLLLP